MDFEAYEIVILFKCFLPEKNLNLSRMYFQFLPTIQRKTLPNPNKI